MTTWVRFNTTLFMMPTILSWEALLRTIQMRPYVFAFLISFLIIGVLNRGWRNTLIFLGLGFGIAYLSEFTSIRWGVPYGMYHYRYENLQGELLLWGVPVWDSLSYSFLAYASYEYAAWLAPPHSGPLPFLAAFLMTALDIVVDPLAVRGDRWFLGDIFYYPNGGIYFGVPLSNFAGWFLVAFLIVGSYQFCHRERSVAIPRQPRPAGDCFVVSLLAMTPKPLLGPLLYWGILLFNLVITAALQEWKLLACGIILHVGIMSLWFLCRRRRVTSSPHP